MIAARKSLTVFVASGACLGTDGLKMFRSGLYSINGTSVSITSIEDKCRGYVRHGKMSGKMKLSPLKNKANQGVNCESECSTRIPTPLLKPVQKLKQLKSNMKGTYLGQRTSKRKGLYFLKKEDFDNFWEQGRKVREKAFQSYIREKLAKMKKGLYDLFVKNYADDEDSRQFWIECTECDPSKDQELKKIMTKEHLNVEDFWICLEEGLRKVRSEMQAVKKQNRFKQCLDSRQSGSTVTFELGELESTTKKAKCAIKTYVREKYQKLKNVTATDVVKYALSTLAQQALMFFVCWMFATVIPVLLPAVVLAYQVAGADLGEGTLEWMKEQVIGDCQETVQDGTQAELQQKLASVNAKEKEAKGICCKIMQKICCVLAKLIKIRMAIKKNAHKYTCLDAVENLTDSLVDILTNTLTKDETVTEEVKRLRSKCGKKLPSLRKLEQVK